MEHRSVVNLTRRHRPVVVYVAPTRSFNTMRSLDHRARGVIGRAPDPEPFDDARHTTNHNVSLENGAVYVASL